MKNRTTAGKLADAVEAVEIAQNEVLKLVVACRLEGYSWEVIGTTLKMTRQGAQQAYGEIVRLAEKDAAGNV